jgi:signal transduction histidine kinase
VSIRLRLTLVYSAILAFTLIAFSAILYASQTRATYDAIRANLVRQASFITGPPDGARPDGPPPGEFPAMRVFVEGDNVKFVLPGRWTQAVTPAGAVLAHSRDLGDVLLPLSARGLVMVQNGAPWYETATVETEPLLIYSRSFTAADGKTAIVQVGFPISQAMQSLNSLRLLLLAGSTLAIIAGLAVGWALAGAALRPVDRITRTAQAIGAEHDFSRRVEHKGPTDEVGRLAVTLNDMLAELESAYRQVEGALDSQRRFVADASHELRTPLTTVRGNVALLQRRPPLALQERAEILADTTEEVDRLIRLVNQLLVLARVDAGQALGQEPILIGPLLDEVCRQARLLSSNALIEGEAATDTPALGDRDALKQVLLILVDNALVHTSPGTTIRMTADPMDGQVAIHVSDTGPGIAPDVLPHIFERFYRGQVARSGVSTGLGLSIAKELVEAQGGTMAVESVIGQGSTFTVTLPQAGYAA